jgi:hypothetical protein
MIVLLLLSCSTPPPETPSLKVSLTFTMPTFKARRPVLVLKGTCPLSDGVILKVSLNRKAEHVLGEELRPRIVGVGTATAELQGGMFSYDIAIHAPGSYFVKVQIPADLQAPEVREEVRERVRSDQVWTFDLDLWNDSLVAMMAEALPEVRELASEVALFLERCEVASKTPKTLDKEREQLLREGRPLLTRLEQHRTRQFFPAAVNTLSYVVHALIGYQGESTWASLKHWIQSTPSLAGRELCLWVIKERRRTSAPLHPALVKALASRKDAPGVGRMADLLAGAPLSELDALEKRVRAGK